MFHTRTSTPEHPECHWFRLAFKMALEALRLWFDCRLGRRGGLRAEASVSADIGLHRGVEPLKLALLFEVE